MAMNTILSQINPHHILTPSFFKIRFNIIILFKHKSLVRSILFRFSNLYTQTRRNVITVVRTAKFPWSFSFTHHWICTFLCNERHVLPQTPAALLSTSFLIGDISGKTFACICRHFWVVTPCNFAVVYQRFGGPCCLLLQGEIIEVK
jgi:hypothetical protein